MSDWLAANLRQRADYDAICRAERGRRVAIVGALDASALRRLTARIALADELDLYPPADLGQPGAQVRP